MQSNKPDEGDIQKLTSMGFGREPSIAALKNSNGSVDAAIDSLLGGGSGGGGKLKMENVAITANACKDLPGNI